MRIRLTVALLVIVNLLQFISPGACTLCRRCYVTELLDPTSRDPGLMMVLRRLWEEAAVHGFDLCASLRGAWTAGDDNPLADALSRDAVPAFLEEYQRSHLAARFGEPRRLQVDEARLRDVLNAIKKACAASAAWRASHERALERAAAERARRAARAEA